MVTSTLIMLLGSLVLVHSSTYPFDTFDEDAVTTVGRVYGHLGASGANLGDINGDGQDDAIFSEHGYDNSSGLAHVLFGNSSLTQSGCTCMLNSSSYGFTISLGGSPHANFGVSVAGGGDINGDGINDILVGGNQYNNNSGIVALIWGRENTTGESVNALTMDVTVGIRITAADQTQVGTVVAFIGDFNGDEIDDFIVTAPFYNGECGAVYIIFGARKVWEDFELSAETAFKITGSTPTERLGSSAGLMRYFNNDSFTDIALGAPAYDTLSHTGAGRIYGFLGGPDFTNGSLNLGSFVPSDDSGFILEGVHDNHGVGSQIGTGCDLDKDGLNDMFFSASNENRDNLSVAPGAGYSIYGRDTGMDSLSLESWISGDGRGVRFSGSLSGSEVHKVEFIDRLRYLDNDEFPDFVIGSSDSTRIVYGHGDAYKDAKIDSLALSGYRTMEIKNTTGILNLGSFYGVEEDNALMLMNGNYDLESGDAMDAGAIVVIKSFPHDESTYSPSSSPSSNPTSPPSVSPSLNPSMMPTSIPSYTPSLNPSVAPTPTSVPGCQIIVSTVDVSSLMWNLTDASGASIESGEFDERSITVSLVSSEEYTLELSGSEPTGSISVSIDGGDASTIPLQGVDLNEVIVEITCEAVSSNIKTGSNSGTMIATSFVTLLMILLSV